MNRHEDATFLDELNLLYAGNELTAIERTGELVVDVLNYYAAIATGTKDANVVKAARLATEELRIEAEALLSALSVIEAASSGSKTH